MHYIYAGMISEAIGTKDEIVLVAVEDVMRSRHSTLDDLDRIEFDILAREAVFETTSDPHPSAA